MTIRYRLSTPIAQDPVTTVQVQGLYISALADAIHVDVSAGGASESHQIPLTPGETAALRGIIKAKLEAVYGSGAFEVTE